MADKREVVVVGCVRAAIGSFGGTLRLSSSALSTAVKEAISDPISTLEWTTGMVT